MYDPRMVVHSDAQVYCEEANRIAKNVFKKISPYDDSEIEVNFLQIEDILNIEGVERSCLHSVNITKEVKLSKEFYSQVKKEFKSEEIKIRYGMEIFPNPYRGINPTCLNYKGDKSIELIKSYFENQTDQKVFVSYPMIRYDKLIFVITTLSKELYEKSVVLPQIHTGDWLTSFLNQVIEILSDYFKELMYIGMNISLTSLNMSDNEIINLACRDMIEGRGLPKVDIFNKISSQTYEGDSCTGMISFVDDIEQVTGSISLQDPICINEDNIRLIRKLLEVSGDGYCLYAKGRYIYSYGAFDNSLNVESIEFLGHGKWRVMYQGQEMLRCHNGEIILPKNEVEYEESIKEVLQRYFGESDCSINNEKLIKIVKAAKEQKHGTMIIISKEASSESERLCGNGRGILIEPSNLEQDYVKKLSSIDGALMIGLDGTCYGIGVIVDGISECCGSASRGARYNSAKNYVYNRNKDKKECIAIVISEDRTIDIIF